MPPLISVILPVYNQEKYVAETIESVLAQTFKDFELLLHDDGSTDGSAAIIRQYAARDPRIRASFAANCGRCEATNYLIRQAKGQWCALFDADDVMLPERLEKQLAYHQVHPETDATSCHCQYINERGKHLGTQRHPGLHTPEEGRQTLASGQFVHCAITGMMISRDAYQRSGGLRSQYWPCDDFEFFNRLVEQGFTLVIIQEVLVRYRIHSSAITTQKPMHTFDKIGYVMACLHLRRVGQAESSFEEFMAERQRNPWWVKVNRRRYNYAQFFFRNAGIAVMSKQYFSFGWQIVLSSLLSPGHLLQKASAILRR
jgi:glycosyltransferase involved in cell wall biosynthesis